MADFLSAITLTALLGSFTVAAPTTVHHTLSGPLLRGDDVETDTTMGTVLSMQAADARQSADLFARYGGQHAHETDAMMRPFSHGGSSTMMLGFLVQDAVMLIATRHMSPKIRKAVESEAIVNEVGGIGYTTSTIRKYERGAF